MHMRIFCKEITLILSCGVVYLVDMKVKVSEMAQSCPTLRPGGLQPPTARLPHLQDSQARAYDWFTIPPPEIFKPRVEPGLTLRQMLKATNITANQKFSGDSLLKWKTSFSQRCFKHMDLGFGFSSGLLLSAVVCRWVNKYAILLSGLTAWLSDQVHWCYLLRNMILGCESGQYLRATHIVKRVESVNNARWVMMRAALDNIGMFSITGI